MKLRALEVHNKIKMGFVEVIGYVIFALLAGIGLAIFIVWLRLKLMTRKALRLVEDLGIFDSQNNEEKTGSGEQDFYWETHTQTNPFE